MFVSKKFHPATKEVIKQADEIMREYAEMGFSLTLRQLYYQFVARGLVANRQKEYTRLGNIVSDARLAGLLDWDWIEDRTRNLATFPSWVNPESIIESAAASFRLNPWIRQKNYVEVWVEKEALIGVIESACQEFRVPHFACRGYTSQSELYVAGKRLGSKKKLGKQVTVLHLGDHDPSGIDMTRDNTDRLSMFAQDYIRVERLALNFDQIEELNPPPNPAKQTDSRFESYEREYGTESWELDALDPRYIAGLVTREIRARIDLDEWNDSMSRETQCRSRLAKCADRWNEVEQFLVDTSS